MTRNPFGAITAALCLLTAAGPAGAQAQAPPARPNQPADDGLRGGPIRSDGSNKTYHERAPVDPSIPAGKMVFESTIHDFGHIVDTDSAEGVFPFRNDGPGDLIIYAINSTCGCTVAELDKTIYKPAETGSIKVTFNPAGKRDANTKRITVQSNDPQAPVVTLQVSAFVEPLVGFEPAFLSFGNLRKGEVQSRVITITGRSADFTLSDLTVIGNPALTAEVVSTEPFALADGSTGRRIEIEVTTDGTNKPGALQAQLTAKTSEPRKPEINTNIAGAVLGDVNLDAERLPIGVLTPGKTFERVIRVENRLGKPFAFLGAELKAPIGENAVNWELLPAPQDVGSSDSRRNTYDVKVTITAGNKNGPLRGTLIFKTDVPDEEAKEVPFWGTVRAPKQ